MNEEKQLTFNLGISNVPSDTTCDDNALEECVGMVYDNGEHRVIQRPVKIDITIPSGSKLVGIHVLNGQTRYILKGATMVQWTVDGTTVHDIVAHNNGDVQTQAIGKTLVVSTAGGLFYLLWDDNEYKRFGNKLPDIAVRFSLSSPSDYQDPNTKVISLGGFIEGAGVIQANGFTGAGSRWVTGKYEDAKTALVGLVSQRLNKVKEAKKFAFPFWIRFALRMYDGSHTKLSNPILMMPTVKNNWKIFSANVDDGGYHVMDENAGGWPWVNYRPSCSSLKFQVEVPQGVNIDDWQDLIRGIDVYASAEVKTFDMEGTWKIENFAVRQGSDWIANPIFNNSDYPVEDFCSPVFTSELIPPLDEVAHMRTYFHPAALSDDDIKKQLMDNSTFYKLFELDNDDLRNNTLRNAADKIAKSTVLNLTTQEQLEHDDYYSHTSIIPSVIKAYNSRLHMGNISRSFFDGYDNFSYSAYSGQAQSALDFYTYIASESGDRIVKKTITTKEIEKLWFYYPDPRAYKVEIYKNGLTKIFSASLKEHPHLNGAYYFGDLPYGGEAQDDQEPVSVPPTVNDTAEVLENQLIVSEVNNPYVFNADGYIRVGMGRVIGMATQTEAVGQEEHGTHPLIVFTDRGTQLLRMNNEGLYIIADPSKREVCNNPASITETDGAVFFTTEKGLMLMLGNDVKCVSEQMSGKSSVLFNDYLRTAYIAYDYRDGLLWIFDGASHTVNNVTTVGSKYCYVYSLKNGTFARYDFGDGNIVSSAVNNYPDYLLQMGQDALSLIERPDINADGKTVNGTFVFNTYKAFIKTRPMKLGSGMVLKNIMRMKHVKELNSDGTLSVNIEGSNDLGQWRQLKHLRGIPWKYYRMTMEFENLKATDRYAGVILITQNRRTNKLR